MDTQPILSSVPETSGAAGPLPERKVTHTFPAPSPADTETLPCPDAAPAETPEGALPGETPEVPGKRCFRLPPWVRERVTAARAAFLLGPWIAYLIVEILNNNNPFTAHSAEQVALNLVWYYLIFWLFRMILGRKVLSGGVSAVVCFLFGLANHYVLSFRGRIIFPCDLLTLDTAAVVARSYDYTPDREIWIALAILGGYLRLLLLAHVIYHPRGRQRLGRKLLWGSIAGMVIYLFAFFFTPLLPSIGIYTQQWRTQQNGFLLNFTTAIRYSFVSEPEDYDADKVAQTARSYPSQSVDAAGELPENLIFIMNESFADLTAAFPNLELSEDPLAFYHSLTENTVKGTMISPVTGGGTANVEFPWPSCPPPPWRTSSISTRAARLSSPRRRTWATAPSPSIPISPPAGTGLPSTPGLALMRYTFRKTCRTPSTSGTTSAISRTMSRSSAGRRTLTAPL